MSSQIVFDVPFAVTEDHREKEEICLVLWQRTVGYINHVLETDKEWGLFQFNEKITPSVEELRKLIDKAKSLLDRMVEVEGLTHGAANTLLNCSRAIAELRCTFDAVVDQKQGEYDVCVQRLNAILNSPI